MQEKEINHIGKFLALILRHKPEVGHLTLNEHGWADCDAVINAVRDCTECHDFSKTDLDTIVDTDSKKRYAYNDNDTKIRASQGHSVPVDLELAPTTPPDILYHGSATRYEDSIARYGLLPESRNFVQMSTDVETAKAVGTRHGVPVVYEVLAKEMCEAGHQFFQSANGVWMSKSVPSAFLRKKN